MSDTNGFSASEAGNEGGYFLPTDSEERKRLDTQHELFNLTLEGKLFLSPVTDPSAILDVGCGTSNWPADAARLFPNAEVTGIDLGQCQPTAIPTNYRYVVSNFEEDWPFERNLFDLIHSRFIFIAMKNHHNYIRQSFTHLKPGGWLEVQELSFPWGSTGSLDQWCHYMMDGAAKIGTDLTAGTKFDAWMAEAGFKNIHHRIFLWPLGVWPKDPALKLIGNLARRNIYDGLEGFSLANFTKNLGWSKDEVDRFVAQLRRDLMDDDHRWFMSLRVIYGQKTESA